MACTLCADVGSYVRRFPTRYTSKMKLVVALALAAAMPSAQAMGKYKACDDSAQCVAFEGPGRCENDETKECESRW